MTFILSQGEKALFDGTRIYLVLRAQTGNFGGRQPLTILIERGMTEPPLPALPIS